jgi:hypothetical protein
VGDLIPTDIVAADLDDIATRLDGVAPGLDVWVVGHGVSCPITLTIGYGIADHLYT